MPLPLQRCYTKDLFDTCVTILHKNAIKPVEAISQFQKFASRVEQAFVDYIKDDLTYGEIPSEFKGQFVFLAACIHE